MSVRPTSNQGLIAQPLKIGDVQLTDIIQAKNEHSKAFESHPPSTDGRCNAKWFRNFRTEDASTTKFEPLAFPLDFNFEAGLRVREVAGRTRTSG